MKVKRVDAKGGSGDSWDITPASNGQIISRILELLELGRQVVGVHNVYQRLIIALAFVNILLICKWASVVSKQSGSFLRTEATVLVTPHCETGIIPSQQDLEGQLHLSKGRLSFQSQLISCKILCDYNRGESCSQLCCLPQQLFMLDTIASCSFKLASDLTKL